MSVFYLVLWFPAHAQKDKEGNNKKDSLNMAHPDEDLIFGDVINLDEVYLLEKLHFKTDLDRKRYLILRRKTRKVYPYAKLAAERLTEMESRLSQLKKKSDKRKYTRIVQRYVEEEFSDTLKNMTRSEGQILVKLIYRQTGRTTFDLIKELRTGWKAFWSNVTAGLFEISLKEEYHPFEVREDYMIEDILERSFQEGVLERQRPYHPINYLDLTSYWNKKNAQE